MPKVKVNGINLYYEIYGSGESVVFVAGLAADHNIWGTVLSEFSKKYQVIIFDNRGIGQSDHPDCLYSIEMMADDTIELVEKIGLNKAHFIGSSVGGLIVQQIAYKYPRFTKSIVIENSTYKFRSLRLSTIGKSILSLMGKNTYSEEVFKIVLHFVYSEKFLGSNDALENITNMVFQSPYQVAAAGYRGQFNACMTFDSSTWLNKICCPALVIMSDKDLLVDPAESKELAAQINNAQYYCFKDVGHLPHVERPEEFCNVVFEFITKVLGFKYNSSHPPSIVYGEASKDTTMKN